MEINKILVGNKNHVNLAKKVNFLLYTGSQLRKTKTLLYINAILVKE